MRIPSPFTNQTTHYYRLLRCVFAILPLLGTSIFAEANIQYYTGVELTNVASVKFPDGAPSPNGASVILGPANTARGTLIAVQYPPGGNSTNLGSPEAFVSWELSRLSCDISVGCNGAGGPGELDHDPIFIISQDDKAYAWQIADNIRGSYYTGAFEMSGNAGGPWLTYTAKYENTNFFPAVGQRYNIDISFTLLSDRVISTMNVVLLGRKDIISIPHTFSYFGGFDPNRSFMIGIINEDNRGERYMLNGAGIAPVAEPGTLSYLLLGTLLTLGLSRRVA